MNSDPGFLAAPNGNAFKVEKASGPADWFVTFGDLLTLLLCFFLSLVSFGPLGANENSEQLQAVSDMSQGQNTRQMGHATVAVSGIELATNPLNDGQGVRFPSPSEVVWLDLTAGDFESDALRPNEAALQKAGQLIGELGDLQPILVESCSRAASGLEAQAIDRALILGAELKKAGARKMSYRITKGCAAGQNEQAPLAQIGFGDLAR